MEEKKRIVGLDWLRILSMFGIVMLHVLGFGGILTKTEGVAYYCQYFFEIVFFASVDVFALLSGYLSIGKKKSLSRTLELMSIVLFYCVAATVAFLLFDRSALPNLTAVVKSVFPMLAGRYWYIVCLIPVLLFEPQINAMLNSLSLKSYRLLVLGSVFLFSVIPSVATVDFFAFSGGYSFAWLLTCYVIGGYLRKTDFGFLKNVRRRILYPVYIAAPVVLLAGNYLLDRRSGGHHGYMVSYISPLILLFSVVTLFLFSRMNGKPNRVLKSVSALSFDVYIIHAHILVFDFLITDRFAWIPDLPVVLGVLAALGCGAAIYAGCTAVGAVRAFLYRVTGFEKLFPFLERKFDAWIGDDPPEPHP